VSGRSRRVAAPGGFVLFLLAAATPALAHGTEGGFVLLLPTRFYLAGAAIAVAASFVLLALVPAPVVERVAQFRLPLFPSPRLSPALPSTLAFLFLAMLVLAGIFGSRDPVENPLPLFIWTVWWVGFTLLQAVVGPLWQWLNPWSGPLAVLRRITGIGVGNGFLRLPGRVGYGIAILQFFAFAWYELIDLAPSDPFRLAVAVIGYWLLNLAGMIAFGERDWSARAEPFGIFFGLVGGMSPFGRRQRDGHVRVGLVWPGRMLLDRTGMPVSGVLFVLLALASVSFDGFSRTFVWLSSIGINPLEFPGRSAVTVAGTAGLIGAFALLSVVFFAAVAGGCALIGRRGETLQAAGRLIYSIVPISIAFHFAHYFTSLLTDGQSVRIVASDPFGRGWNLFGTANDYVTMSFMNTFEGVRFIWNTQTAAIALGHIAGIVMAHVLAIRMFGPTKAATLSQVFLAALMVFYTAFGLWLLSTPRI
jgi:hypothetical protein